MNLGELTLTKNDRGECFIEQHWNSSNVKNNDRKQIASALHEIADMILADKFEDGGIYLPFLAKENRDDETS